MLPLEITPAQNSRRWSSFSTATPLPTTYLISRLVVDSPVLDTYQEIFVSSGWRKNNNNLCPHLRRLSVKQTLVILPLFRSLGSGSE
jgi:hypothetical protein